MQRFLLIKTKPVEIHICLKFQAKNDWKKALKLLKIAIQIKK